MYRQTLCFSFGSEQAALQRLFGVACAVTQNASELLSKKRNHRVFKHKMTDFQNIGHEPLD